MRLGAPLPDQHLTPESWAAQLRSLGYRAAFCPLSPGADDADIRAFEEAARAADIVIAEVGAWSNPLSPDEGTRTAAIGKCIASLELAERIGARCCVNIAGSRGEKWDGPCAEDLTGDTFELIVDTVRRIVDEVKPRRSWYTLETMPWMYPDSADSYLELLDAIDRSSVGVHFDPVNIINCPERYFRNAGLVTDFVARLGPRIRSCHAKDIRLQDRLTVHLDETRPGLGGLDYRALLRALAALEPGLPLMLEHLPSQADYAEAAAYVRRIAAEERVGL